MDKYNRLKFDVSRAIIMLLVHKCLLCLLEWAVQCSSVGARLLFPRELSVASLRTSQVTRSGTYDKCSLEKLITLSCTLLSD
jgi:hypothetical protein